MKKKLKIIMVIIMVSIISFMEIVGFASAKSKRIHAVKLYDTFLSQSHKLWSYSEFRHAKTTDDDIRFRLFDINMDGIPELLVHDDNACNGDGQLAIYSIVNGKVKYIYSYALWDVTFYSNKKGTIYYTCTRDGGLGEYQQFNGKKIKKIQYWGAALNLETFKLGKKSYYLAKGKKISKKQFNQTKEKLTKAKNKLTISEDALNMFQNTKKNRAKYLK